MKCSTTFSPWFRYNWFLIFLEIVETICSTRKAKSNFMDRTDNLGKHGCKNDGSASDYNSDFGKDKGGEVEFLMSGMDDEQKNFPKQKLNSVSNEKKREKTLLLKGKQQRRTKRLKATKILFYPKIVCVVLPIDKFYYCMSRSLMFTPISPKILRTLPSNSWSLMDKGTPITSIVSRREFCAFSLHCRSVCTTLSIGSEFF